MESYISINRYKTKDGRDAASLKYNGFRAPKLEQSVSLDGQPIIITGIERDSKYYGGKFEIGEEFNILYKPEMLARPWPKKLKLNVGQAWIAYWDDYPGDYWIFEIVAEIYDYDERFWVAVRHDLEEYRLPIIFDDYGRERDWKVGGTQSFYLVRRSRTKPWYTQS